MSHTLRTALNQALTYALLNPLFDSLFNSLLYTLLFASARFHKIYCLIRLMTSGFAEAQNNLLWI